MTAQLHDTLDRALYEAVGQHFVKLFNVLMSDPSDEAFIRFETGLGKTLAVYDRLRRTLDDLQT